MTVSPDTVPFIQKKAIANLFKLRLFIICLHCSLFTLDDEWLNVGAAAEFLL